jgi:hypothetical protein
MKTPGKETTPSNISKYILLRRQLLHPRLHPNRSSISLRFVSQGAAPNTAASMLFQYDFFDFVIWFLLLVALFQSWHPKAAAAGAEGNELGTHGGYQEIGESSFC